MTTAIAVVPVMAPVLVLATVPVPVLVQDPVPIVVPVLVLATVLVPVTGMDPAQVVVSVIARKHE